MRSDEMRMAAQDVWRGMVGGRAQAPVRDRRRRARGRVRIGRTAVLAAAVLVCGLVHVWVRLQVTTLGYDLSAAREIVARLEQEQRELETELAMLTAPQRLEEEASRRLRMHEPKPGQVVVLR